MKIIRTFLLLCVLLGAAGFALVKGAEASGMRWWTSASGKRIKAELVEAKWDTVVLRKEDGGKVQIRMQQLSREDQIFAQSADGTTGATTKKKAEEDVPAEIERLFGKRLVNAKKKTISPAELAGKKIGIYFSAHWCPPCRTFTPKLVEAYNQMQEDGKAFEIVFVSHDRDKSSMYGYMKELNMPWLAVPFNGTHAKKLKEDFGIRGIPTLIVVDAKGEVLSRNARGEVQAYGAAAYDKW